MLLNSSTLQLLLSSTDKKRRLIRPNSANQMLRTVVHEEMSSTSKHAKRLKLHKRTSGSMMNPTSSSNGSNITKERNDPDLVEIGLFYGIGKRDTLFLDRKMNQVRIEVRTLHKRITEAYGQVCHDSDEFTAEDAALVLSYAGLADDSSSNNQPLVFAQWLSTVLHHQRHRLLISHMSERVTNHSTPLLEYTIARSNQSTAAHTKILKLSTRALPPLRLNAVGDKNGIQGRLLEHSGYDEHLTRDTPRCLQGGENMFSIADLRRELEIANHGLAELDNRVNKGIAWAQSNCQGRSNISAPARDKCQTIAARRLVDLVESHCRSTQLKALLRWQAACLLHKHGSTVSAFARAKSLACMVKVLTAVGRRELHRGWTPWRNMYIEERRLERLAAIVQIQRVVRGHQGRKIATIRLREHSEEVRRQIIQLMHETTRAQREFEAKKRKLAKELEEEHLAKMAIDAHRIQEFYKGRLAMRRAKSDLLGLRQNKAALVVQGSARMLLAKRQLSNLFVQREHDRLRSKEQFISDFVASTMSRVIKKLTLVARPSSAPAVAALTVVQPPVKEEPTYADESDAALLKGVVGVQSLFRRKKAIADVRDERERVARARLRRADKVGISIHIGPDNSTAIVKLQSVMRGRLARKLKTSLKEEHVIVQDRILGVVKNKTEPKVELKVESAVVVAIAVKTKLSMEEKTPLSVSISKRAVVHAKKSADDVKPMPVYAMPTTTVLAVTMEDTHQSPAVQSPAVALSQVSQHTKTHDPPHKADRPKPNKGPSREHVKKSPSVDDKVARIGKASSIETAHSKRSSIAVKKTDSLIPAHQEVKAIPSVELGSHVGKKETMHGKPRKVSRIAARMKNAKVAAAQMSSTDAAADVAAVFAPSDESNAAIIQIQKLARGRIARKLKRMHEVKEVTEPDTIVDSMSSSPQLDEHMAASRIKGFLKKQISERALRVEHVRRSSLQQIGVEDTAASRIKGFLKKQLSKRLSLPQKRLSITPERRVSVHREVVVISTTNPKTVVSEDAAASKIQELMKKRLSARMAVDKRGKRLIKHNKIAVASAMEKTVVSEDVAVSRIQKCMKKTLSYRSPKATEVLEISTTFSTDSWSHADANSIARSASNSDSIHDSKPSSAASLEKAGRRRTSISSTTSSHSQASHTGGSMKKTRRRVSVDGVFSLQDDDGGHKCKVKKKKRGHKLETERSVTEDAEEQAAVKLQCLVRGRQARSKVRNWLSKSEDIQRNSVYQEDVLGDGAFRDRLLEDQAAIKLQRHMRALSVRSRIKFRRRSLTIQSDPVSFAQLEKGVVGLQSIYRRNRAIGIAATKRKVLSKPQPERIVTPPPMSDERGIIALQCLFRRRKAMVIVQKKREMLNKFPIRRGVSFTTPIASPSVSRPTSSQQPAHSRPESAGQIAREIAPEEELLPVSSAESILDTEASSETQSIQILEDVVEVPSETEQVIAQGNTLVKKLEIRRRENEMSDAIDVAINQTRLVVEEMMEEVVSWVESHIYELSVQSVDSSDEVVVQHLVVEQEEEELDDSGAESKRINIAVYILQRFGRVLVARRIVAAKRRKAIAMQEKIGKLLEWSSTVIQRYVRGNLCRKRILKLNLKRKADSQRQNAKQIEFEERFQRLESMEAKLKEREAKMLEATQAANEKADALTRALQLLEERAKRDEAERAARDMLSKEIVIASGASETMNVSGVVWQKVWDATSLAWYWYCPATGVSQWEDPSIGDDGYESTGALTDYSTEYYGSDIAESEFGDGGKEEWQEFWDESAQSKYWYNTATCEATWIKPESLTSSIPADVEQDADNWISCIDEAIGQEYWYNTKTGEKSWA